MSPMRLLILIQIQIQNLIYDHYEGQIQILNLSLPILLVPLVLLIEKKDQNRILIQSPMAQPLFPHWTDVS